MSQELWRLSAREAVTALQNGEVSSAELIDAAAARIEETNGAVNSMVTLCLDRARAHGQKIADGEAEAGLLHGLPVAIKDLEDVEGVRTTNGSPIYRDNISKFSTATVEALEDNGGVVIGKTNTPEFGAGANTFNEVFGTTVTPWDTTKTCGGSSGGSAAALAAGQVWLATGSDHGGSLRIPAAFCGVVGLRPSAGRVPSWPKAMPFETHQVIGPMARNVGDVGLMLDAMARFDDRDPLTFEPDGESFRAAAEAPQAPARIGYAPNLGGAAPVDAEVAEICGRAVQAFAAMESDVTDECPDFSGASQAFQVRRAMIMAVGHKAHYENHKELLKPDLIWNIEKGQNLSMDEIIQAENYRTKLYQQMIGFFETHDLLITPTVMVPPFAADQHYVSQVGDVVFDDYVEWLFHTFALTLTTCPAISIPCGETAAGLPVGLQLVARHRGEAELLSYAAALEAALSEVTKVPMDPITRN
jgi:amidase